MLSRSAHPSPTRQLLATLLRISVLVYCCCHDAFAKPFESKSKKIARLTAELAALEAERLSKLVVVFGYEFDRFGFYTSAIMLIAICLAFIIHLSMSSGREWKREALSEASRGRPNAVTTATDSSPNRNRHINVLMLGASMFFFYLSRLIPLHNLQMPPVDTKAWEALNGTNFLISTLLVSAVYWYLEFDKLPRAFPQVFSWSDPSFWAVYLRAVFLQIAFIQIRNPDHVALLSKLVHQKSGPLKQLFRLHNYKTDIIVNQDTNPIEQSLRAAATRFSSNRVRERFCVAYQIFQELVQMTAQRGQPLNTSMASALFKHSNKILFDYIPSTFTSMDMTELIDFLNFDNLDGIGLLQTFCPWTYKLPLRRNKRRNAIIEKFGPLWESILKQQKTLINQGRDCLLLAALENIHDKDSRKKIEEDDDCLKSFFMGLYIASFLTSITTSCVVLHHLAKNHHAQELIAQEIKDTFPEDMKDLTHSHLMRLVHTRSFVMEVMRYFSPAPSLGRRVGRINLNLSLKALNESSSLWDKPKRLVPNRFVSKSRLDRRSHKFFPFGVGRRSCPGQEYVQFEFVLIVALFVREYKIRHEDLDTQLHLSYLGSIPTIMNPSDLVFDFFPRHINTNRRAALMRQKSTASFMMPGTTQRTFSGVAKLNGIFMGT